jgi:ligand-binding sensor domain-containing protein
VFVPVALGERVRDIPITALVQAPDGALWLATQGAGLVCYRESETRCEFFNTTTGLPGDVVSGLVADRQGTLWAIAGFKLLTLEQKQWRPPTGIEPLDGQVVALAPSADGGLWVGTTFPQVLTERGGLVFKLKDRHWVAELAPYLWAQDTIFTHLTALLENREGRVWAGTPGAGLFHWDGISKWRELSPNGVLAQLDCSCFFLDGEDALWVGTALGELLQVCNRPVKTLHLPAAAEKNILRNACVARDGSIWVGTDGAGVFRYRQGQFARYAEEQGVADGHIGVIFEDRLTN